MAEESRPRAWIKGKTWYDLLVIDILVLILIAGILLFPSNVQRAIIGFPFILFFPGYVLTIVLFPRKTSLNGIIRTTISLGLSIAVTGIISLILNFTTWGIRLETDLYSLAAFIFVMSGIAWLIQRRFLPEERYGRRQINISLSWGATRRERLLSIILIIVIVGALTTAGFALFTPKTGQTFTEFYILATDGSTNYPRALRAGTAGQVTLGIVNHEAKTTGYTVSITIGGVKVNSYGPLTLNAEEKWEQTVTFTPGTPGTQQEVDFILYKNGGAAPYMQPLRLWIDVTQ
jgi:uncharacterized membrane protein